MKILLLLSAILLLSLFACGVERAPEAKNKAQYIIDRSIEYHGGAAYRQMRVEYQFRKGTYSIANKDGAYTYTRSFEKEGQTIKDILKNDGELTRTIDGETVEVPDSMGRKYANSTNSVNYFTQLPYRLNDSAVNKSYEGETNIKGKKYEVLKVTFDEEGGGDDFDDTYYYWFDSENHSLDYLAYDFHVNGGGVRFRSAYNQRTIDGIRFQDYINYKAPKNTELVKLPELLEAGKLEELSRIELRNIKFLN
ncbi:MAG: DUF6503 family protein [Bacteroidota bacterium]